MPDVAAGVAGALAINVVVSRVEAFIADGTSVVITGGGDVTITATNEVSTTTKASGKQEGGGDTGVGASVALNIVDMDTLANRQTFQHFLDAGITHQRAGGLRPGGPEPPERRRERRPPARHQ